MPQFDTFIFSSSLFYFIVIFFLLLYQIFTQFLPRLGAILKLRSKVIEKASGNMFTILPSLDHITIFPRILTNTTKD